MRDILVTLVILGSIPFIFRRPYIGVLVYCWISYMNPHRLTWGFAYDMPFAALIGGVTLIAIVISKESKKIPIYSIIIVWFLWIAWMNVTTIFAIIPDDAVWKWDRSMKIQLMAIITLMVMKSPERIKLLVWVLAISVGIYGIKGGIFTLATGGNYIIFGAPGTYFSGSNALAVALLMVLPLFLYLLFQTKNKWVKRGLLVAMILISLSILSSYSRGAFLGASAILLYLTLKSKKKMILIPAILAVAMLGLSFMPQKWYDRISTIQTYEEDSSAMGRINSWYFAYNLANDKPIVGGGFNVFDPRTFQIYAPEPENFNDAHSIYFEVLGEHGYIGLILFLLLGWLALSQGNYIRKNTKDNSDLQWAFNLATMTQVSIIGYAVAGAFVGLAYFDLYYHLICILVLTRQEIDKVTSLKNQHSGGIYKRT